MVYADPNLNPIVHCNVSNAKKKKYRGLKAILFETLKIYTFPLSLNQTKFLRTKAINRKQLIIQTYNYTGARFALFCEKQGIFRRYS